MRNDLPDIDNAVPVIIGGLGGSGTRVVAQILIALGYDLGSDLNEANDNLSITLLLKHYFLGRRLVSGKPAASVRSLRLYKKIVRTTAALTLREKVWLCFLATRMALFGSGPNRLHAGPWAFQRLKRVFQRAKVNDISKRWGWKEPNSHVFLPVFSKVFADFKYIHVVRDGQYMRQSKNKNQLDLWYALYGMTRKAAVSGTPEAAYTYWERANARALAFKTQLRPDQFFLMHYEELCDSPKNEIERLLAFLGLPVSEADVLVACVDSQFNRHKIPTAMVD